MAGLLAPSRSMKYRVLIEPDEDGVFVATVPALPGCISQGATRDEAVLNVREAIRAHLESLEAHGEPVPPSISEEIVEGQIDERPLFDGGPVKYRIALLETDEGYAVDVPGLPGCWSQGATEQEALENIREAIREYLSAREDLLEGAVVREVEVTL
jgi:predicted RNase H-like HicB family nuclease